MTRNRKLKMLYAAAYEYLESKIGKESLDKKLLHYRHHKVDNMPDAFWHLVNSLTNKVGMRATIGDINPLEPFLFGFDPWQTHFHYHDNWTQLFTDIKEKHSPPGPMVKNQRNSYWAIFTKGILSGAEFLAQFIPSSMLLSGNASDQLLVIIFLRIRDNGFIHNVNR